ncbi:hypothetical protein [Terracoccus sp. 273MFTsu3.1]|uniref:hypothetical protein n=1 Tax=Terracoccus sp. 273MFTsu3.1 TaxID=1172188 RepID=UPI00037D3E55|nr:hypothetical protein [Terracoccus sp. 273MFTsu3.1]
MRRLAPLVAAVAAVLLVAAAPPASAGGPTSVLVVDYDGSRAAGALTGSLAYANLEKALDAYNTPTGDAMPAASFMDSRVRLTWLIHDVTPWRVDAVIIDGTDVWVETSMNLADSTDLFQAPTVLHRPKDAALLLATLTSLGVHGDTRPVSTSTSPPPVARPAAAAAGAAPVTRGTGADAARGAVPWWPTTVAAVLALGLGVAIGRRPRAGSRVVRATDTRRADPERPAPVGFSSDAHSATRHTP